jgi:hypothetical protein
MPSLFSIPQMRGRAVVCIRCGPVHAPLPKPGPPAPVLWALGLFFARPCHLDAGTFLAQHGDRRAALRTGRSSQIGARARPPVLRGAAFGGDEMTYLAFLVVLIAGATWGLVRLFGAKTSFGRRWARKDLRLGDVSALLDLSRAGRRPNPDCLQRLRRRGFIGGDDADPRVTMKGRVALLLGRRS